MTIEDMKLSCAECNGEFVFSASEQRFFKTRGLSNLPKRCPNCRLLARLQREGDERQTIITKCDNCSAPTVVPFKPRGFKPVYCFSCLHLKRTGQLDIH